MPSAPDHPVAEDFLPPERVYRGMSTAHAESLQATGNLPPTRETMVSPNRAYTEKYAARGGALVEFRLMPDTTALLSTIGVRDTSRLVQQTYPNMPLVQPGWPQRNAFFKGEGPQINVGLGRGLALEAFNARIVDYDVTRF